MTVTPPSGLTTTEAGGEDTFTVVLDAQPTDDVVVALSSTDTDEGTVSPDSIAFTAENWDAPRTVTVKGVDDDVADEDAVYMIELASASSDDSRYDGIDPSDVEVTNDDDESPGITVEAPVGGLITNENGSSDTFTIVLDSEPTDDVTIALSSSDEDEGTVFPESVTFTPENWNAPQEVTVTGVDDDDDDGPVAYEIITGTTSSIDPDYEDLPVDDVPAVNIDDESPFLSIQPRRKLHFVNENGTVTTTLQIRLSVAPTDDVTCTFGTSDSTEGDIDLTTLTFTPANWDDRQDIIVSGVDDDLADGDQRFTVITNACTSNDLAYSGFDAVNIPVLNRDNE